jgi:hypothetical protein
MDHLLVKNTIVPDCGREESPPCEEKGSAPFVTSVGPEVLLAEPWRLIPIELTWRF